MESGRGSAEKRTKKRIRRRIPCELHAGDRRFTGIVLDVSIDGLFVQTSAALPAGSAVRVRVQETGAIGAFELDAQVARAKRVPPQLVSAAAGGIGLHVSRPPPEFVALQRALEQAGAATGHAARREAAASPAVGTPPAPAAPAGVRFDVRLRQSVGNRSRTIKIEARDAAAARSAALKQVGAGWDVLDVRRAP